MVKSLGFVANVPVNLAVLVYLWHNILTGSTVGSVAWRMYSANLAKMENKLSRTQLFYIPIMRKKWLKFCCKYSCLCYKDQNFINVATYFKIYMNRKCLVTTFQINQISRIIKNSILKVPNRQCSWLFDISGNFAQI